MKNIIKHSSGFILLFLVFNYIWSQYSFDSLPSEIKYIVELFLGPLFFLSFFLGIIFYFFWKVPFVEKVVRLFFPTNPVLQGTWKGTLKYSIDGELKQKETYLAIYQPDAFSVHCRLFTDERESESNNATFSNENGRWVLTYQYRSSESIHRREENPSHSGTTVLVLDDTIKPNRFNGNYFTFRNTSGSIDLVKASSKVAKSRESAKKLSE